MTEDPRDFLHLLDKPEYDHEERSSFWRDLWEGVLILLCLPGWFLGTPFRRRIQRNCMHHDWHEGESWISSQLIDTGMRKMFWCIHCQKTWFN